MAIVTYTVTNLTSNYLRIDQLQLPVGGSKSGLTYLTQDYLVQAAKGNISITASAGALAIPSGNQTAFGAFPITDSTGGTADLTTGVIHSTFNANDLATIIQWVLMINARLSNLEAQVFPNGFTGNV
jgi:hypothetical protein